MDKIVIQGMIHPDQVDTEDGGQAKIAQPEDGDDLGGFFVRLQSWDESRQHTVFNQFVGKRVRVTVEVIG